MFAIFLPFVALSEEDGIVRKETRLYYAVSRSSKKVPSFINVSTTLAIFGCGSYENTKDFEKGVQYSVST